MQVSVSLIFPHHLPYSCYLRSFPLRACKSRIGSGIDLFPSLLHHSPVAAHSPEVPSLQR